MNQELLKKDFYAAVNEEWLKKAKIPSDRSFTGAFLEIYNANERKLRKLAKELVELYDDGQLEDKVLQNFVRYYKLATDIRERNSLKVEPLEPIVNKILELNSLDDFIKHYDYFILHDFDMPFYFGVSQDFKNAQIQGLIFAGPSLLLPEKSYYDDNHPAKASLIATYKSMSRKLLAQYKFSKSKIEKIINNALAFDSSLVPYSMSGQEMVKYVELYNPMDIEELNSYSKQFNFKELAQKLVNKEVNKINVIYPKFAKNIDKIINNETFSQYRDYLLLSFIIKYSKYLDDKNRVLCGKFSRAISGTEKAENKDKAAFYLAYNAFKMPLGLYYSSTYFSTKAKKDVESKIRKMIAVYQKRLQNNTWLSSETKKRAITKLNSLGVHVGYPSEIRSYYEEIDVTETKFGGNLVFNVLKIKALVNQYQFNQYHEEINKHLWGMSPAEVNAYYNPSMNHIVFPAGILNKPFYSTRQSSSANYGGIGAVIAHEISHAFDNNGANFDENGNLNMWWRDKDFATFNQKGQAMKDLFDQRPTEFGPCNGTLTISENIADAGGISCALEASMSEPNHNSQEFFENWATVWRSKYKPEYAKTLLAVDPHAPTKLRANVQVQNLDEFYNAYDISENDEMYLAPEKRVKIW